MSPNATVSDVKEVIDTGLEDSDIVDSLEYANDLNNQFNNPNNQTDLVNRNIERWAAVLNIRQYKERSVSEDDIADAGATYEGDEIGRAKAELGKWDPSNRIASSLLRDDNRKISSTRDT